MDKTIKGVTIQSSDHYSAFIISELSEELKGIIKMRLSAICHGVAKADSGSALYCYKRTLKEFLKRYATKTPKQKKGMIGELILHILISELLDDYEINSPFFNTEERNVKKGFDVVLNKKGSTDIWLAESKSGELHTGKDTSQTVVELIGVAQNDLYNRLNGDSVSLWYNAVNGASLAIKGRDDKDAIIAILEKHGISADNNELKSNDMNVILVGTVFNTTTDPIKSTKIQEKYNRIANSKKFKDVYLVAIQKNTYTAIYDFLESEASE